MRPEGAVALVTGGASGLGRATAQALRARGATVVVADLPDTRERAESAAAGLGPLRVVVNCAGIGPPSRVLRKGEAMALEAFTTTIEINLIAAYDGQIGQAAYAASKGGIVGMTLPIARNLAQSLIRCVTIAPGIFDTPLLGSLPQPARDSLGASVPHPARLGDPAEYGALRMAPR